jgi:carbamoyl-phosphate synthase large subunit
MNEGAMNVLLTCAGRRNYLIQYFRVALGPEGRVFAADASPTAAALAEADAAFVAPHLCDPNYIPWLLEICRAWRVTMVVPLSDYELPYLAAHRAQFIAVGTLPVISSPAVVDICLDKWAAYAFLRERGIATPRTYRLLDDVRAALDRGEVAFPLVVKPRWGSGSSGIEIVMDAEELELAYPLAVRRYARSLPPGVRAAQPSDTAVIQEWIAGDEYGLDVVNDLSGRHVATLAKRKLLMRSGETDRAVTVADARFTALGAALGAALGHLGNLDCDVFDVSGTLMVLEMNPRFGGGYPFAHTAGANLPAALVAWARGGATDPAWFACDPGTTMAKCDRVVLEGEARPALAPDPQSAGASPRAYPMRAASL